MNARIRQRLRELEEARARQGAADEADEVDAGLDRWFIKCHLFLELVGVEQGANESLRSTVARALGISTDELDQRIEAGEDPVHDALMEAIEREKAAGRWPSDVVDSEIR